LVWPKGKNEELVEKRAVPLFRFRFWILVSPDFGIRRFEEVIHPYKYMRIYLWSA